MANTEDTSGFMIPLLAGTFALFAFASNSVLELSEETKTLAMVVGGIGGVSFLATKLKTTRLSKFLDLDRFKVDGRKPSVMHKTAIKNSEEYRCKMPVGLAVSDIENRKDALEEYLCASVDLSFDKKAGNMVVKVYPQDFPDYKYEVIPTTNPLEVCFGFKRDGEPLIFDIEQAPHLLIGGTTGGGKSVFLRSILTSLLKTKSPDALEVVLADFQRVELSIFQHSPMVSAFCSSPDDFIAELSRIREESERRLRAFEQKEVVNIQSYNTKVRNGKFKRILVVVDEFATVSRYPEIRDELLLRISQDRKCGINYIICTQRPSVKIIDGDIKAVMPARIAFKMPTDADSRVILDEAGAEKLTGRGHGIFKFTEKTEFKGMMLNEIEAFRLLKPTFVEKEW